MRVPFGAGMQEVELTSVEFDLLAYFLKTPGHVISRDDMVKAVLRREIASLDRSIDVHVSNLRKKLGPAPDGGDRIRAIRGVGYIYVLPGKSKTRLIRMQRLYFKIFLWFWLAMILVSGTLIFSVVTTQQEFTASGTKQYDEILTSLVASRAADMVEDHGMGALADYLESLDTTLHWQAFLFDDEGNEILSQPTPAEANAIAQAALQTSDTKFLIAHGRKYVAKRTVGSDGTRYVFVMGYRGALGYQHFARSPGDSNHACLGGSAHGRPGMFLARALHHRAHPSAERRHPSTRRRQFWRLAWTAPPRNARTKSPNSAATSITWPSRSNRSCPRSAA